jgi:hypothetical protein
MSTVFQSKDLLPLQCGNCTVMFRVADSEEAENFPRFTANLTRAANALTRATRIASESKDLSSEDWLHAMAGLECLTELAAEVSERLADERLHSVD